MFKHVAPFWQGLDVKHSSTSTRNSKKPSSITFSNSKSSEVKIYTHLSRSSFLYNQFCRNICNFQEGFHRLLHFGKVSQFDIRLYLLKKCFSHGYILFFKLMHAPFLFLTCSFYFTIIVVAFKSSGRNFFPCEIENSQYRFKCFLKTAMNEIFLCIDLIW